MSPTPQSVLACPMQSNDADAETVRDFLVALLSALWDQGEGFSGKRPLGNSGWEWDLYAALGAASLVKGVVFDDDGYVEEVSHDAQLTCNGLIADAIKALAGA